MSSNIAEFKLSITKALGDQLAQSLEQLSPSVLGKENIDKVLEKPGVYQLFHRGHLVYVGKADNSIPTRLWKHFNKLSGRKGVSVGEMTFTALYVEEDFSAVAPERLLIGRFQGEGAVPWNNNGFGINDPGQQRDTTVYKEDHFDCQYPADLDVEMHDLSPGEYLLSDLLRRVKDELPYTFRYANGKKEKGVYGESVVWVADDCRTAHDFFRLISSELPSPWKVVALPGYVIMYPKDVEYKSARRIYEAGEVLLISSPGIS